MPATQTSRALAHVCAQAAADLKATSIHARDVSEHMLLTDISLVIAGSSGRHVRALVDAIEDAVREYGAKIIRREGYDADPHWVLCDLDEVIVHVQQEEDREFYALDKLWSQCPAIDLGVQIEEEESTLDRLMRAAEHAHEYSSQE